MKDRTIKPVSFSHDNAYENELLEYALSASHGKFGPYVKRLIDRDRASMTAGTAPAVPIVTDVAVAQEPVKSSVGKTVAKAFL